MKKFIELEKAIKRTVNIAIGVQVNYVIPVNAMPTTDSGKIQRFKLVERFENGEYNKVIEEMNSIKNQNKVCQAININEIEKNILTICKEYIDYDEIDISDNFFEIGISSLILSQISDRLEKAYGMNIKAANFFENPTIEKLARFIKDRHEYENINEFSQRKQNLISSNSDSSNDDIAIIGLSIKAAGISDLDEYWNCISNGLDMVKDFPKKRIEDLEVYLKSKGYHEKQGKFHKAAYLDNIDSFDYKYFNILPVEAIAMSPAQRLFLEAAATTIEDAGYNRGQLSGSKTGVYVGYIGDIEGYKYQQILQISQDIMTPTGALSSNIASRVSHIMDLKGPSLMVDTACSSSLVALDIACNEISRGNCTQAIVGGIRIKTIPLDDGFQIGFESSDYKARPFDSSANGMVDGEGAAAILIKPLKAAIEDNDNIYAVIKGSGVNHGGGSLGLSTPNPIAQADAVLKCLEVFKVDPSTISYLEAQGTGTPLGDPVEVSALTKAFKKYTDKTQYCSIGTVRSNIGHLFEVSGISSIIKCCLMMKHKMLPPLANFVVANNEIDFENSPFYITKSLSHWEPINGVRRCGINNYGFSGVNCHVILDDFRREDTNVVENSTEKFNLFTLTAKKKVLLGKLVNKYIRFLENNKNTNIQDMCYTRNTGREHHEYRIAIITSSVDDLIIKLKNFKYKTNIDEKLFYGEHKFLKKSKSNYSLRQISIKDIEKLSDVGNRLLLEINEEQKEKQFLRIAQIYVRGAGLNWTSLYENENVRKVSIPTYEFEKLRCWPTF